MCIHGGGVCQHSFEIKYIRNYNRTLASQERRILFIASRISQNTTRTPESRVGVQAFLLS